MPQSESTTTLRIRETGATAQRALRLHQTLARQNRGQIIFLAGQPGSGRTDLLQSLAESFRRESPRPVVISGHFVNGHYAPWDINPAVTLPLREITAAIGESIALIPGLAGFIGQLLQAGAATWEMVESLTKQSQPSPYALTELIRHAAETQPVVCLLDDIDEAEGSGWANWLLDFAPEIATDLPLLFFVTLEGPSELGRHEDDESNLFYIARRLTARGLAEWWPLHPLSRDDVAAWIGPAAPGIAEHLHGVTGGYPGWVIRLWRDWQERGVVAYSDQEARWRWVPNRTPSLNLVKDVLDDRLKKLLGDDDPREMERTRAMLACAALEGQRFTADAIARVMDWDRDELIDFFDDHLVASDEQPDGILQDDGSITTEDPETGQRTLWRYTLVSDLHWHALNRYGLTDSERKLLSLALARTLAGLYAPEEKLVARTLARLFKVGGDESAATRYRRTADYATSREAMRQQAMLMMAVNKDGWDKGRCRQVTAMFMAAGKQMLRAYPFEETLSVFEAAYQMACRSGITADQADALYYCGQLQLNLGDYPAARARSFQALTIFQQIGERAGEAAAWHNLATIDLDVGDYAAAREKFQTALSMRQQIGDRAGEAATWHNLASIDLNVGDYAAAREKFQTALQMRQQIGDRAGEAFTFYQLGFVGWKTGRQVEGARLVALSFLIAQSIGVGEVQQISQNLAGMAGQLGHTPEQVAEMMNEVAESYQRDRGAALLRAAFGEE